MASACVVWQELAKGGPSCSRGIDQCSGAMIDTSPIRKEAYVGRKRPLLDDDRL